MTAATEQRPPLMFELFGLDVRHARTFSLLDAARMPHDVFLKKARRARQLLVQRTKEDFNLLHTAGVPYAMKLKRRRRGDGCHLFAGTL